MSPHSASSFRIQSAFLDDDESTGFVVERVSKFPIVTSCPQRRARGERGHRNGFAFPDHLSLPTHSNTLARSFIRQKEYYPDEQHPGVRSCGAKSEQRRAGGRAREAEMFCCTHLRFLLAWTLSLFAFYFHFRHLISVLTRPTRSYARENWQSPRITARGQRPCGSAPFFVSSLAELSMMWLASPIAKRCQNLQIIYVSDGIVRRGLAYSLAYTRTCSFHVTSSNEQGGWCILMPLGLHSLTFPWPAFGRFWQHRYRGSSSFGPGGFPCAFSSSSPSAGPQHPSIFLRRLP